MYNDVLHIVLLAITHIYLNNWLINYTLQVKLYPKGQRAVYVSTQF